MREGLPGLHKLLRGRLRDRFFSTDTGAGTQIYRPEKRQYAHSFSIKLAVGHAYCLLMSWWEPYTEMWMPPSMAMYWPVM